MGDTETSVVDRQSEGEGGLKGEVCEEARKGEEGEKSVEGEEEEGDERKVTGWRGEPLQSEVPNITM